MTKGLTKGDIAVQLVEVCAKLKRAEAEKIVDTVFAIVAKSLVEARDVSIRIHGFGTFSVSERSARTGRNPKTGETIAIAARSMVRFRCASALKDALL